ncbi:MAG: hypothetical protein ACREJN_18940, partial [Nitrospiraceae bacterium]
RGTVVPHDGSQGNRQGSDGGAESRMAWESRREAHSRRVAKEVTRAYCGVRYAVHQDILFLSTG